MNQKGKKEKNLKRRCERETFKSIGNERYKINLDGLLPDDSADAPDKGDVATDEKKLLTKTGEFTTPDEVRIEFPNGKTPEGTANEDKNSSAAKLLGPNNESGELNESADEV